MPHVVFVFVCFSMGEERYLLACFGFIQRGEYREGGREYRGEREFYKRVSTGKERGKSGRCGQREGESGGWRDLYIVFNC